MHRAGLFAFLSMLVAALVAGLLVGGGASAASQRVSVSTLPGIVGAVNNKPSTSAGKDLVVVSVSPARPGRKVDFYRLVGRKWVVTKRGVRTDSAGRATFAMKQGSAFRWRAKARRYRTLGAKTGTQASVTRWKPVFADQFSGTSLSRQWRVRYPRTWLAKNGKRCSYSEPRAVWVSRGLLRLSTFPVATPPAGMAGKAPTAAERRRWCRDATRSGRTRGRLYASAVVDSVPNNVHQFEFTRGVAAARIRFTPRPGQHSSLWLQTGTANDTEIDVIESYGRSRRPLSAGVHYYSKGWKTSARVVQLRKPTAFSQDFRVYSVEWTPTQYIFRMDGRELFRTSKGRSRTDHHVVLSNWVSDWELKQNTGAQSTTYVDWVKVWQK